MPGKAPWRSYWDACVFLAWIKREPGRFSHVDALMEAAAAGQMEIITSVLSIAEVALAAPAKDAGAVAADALKKIDSLWLPPSPVKLAEFHQVVAFDARDLMRRAAIDGRSLRPPDAIHLSTAARTRCDEFLTYDDLSSLSPLISIPVNEPYSGTLPFESSGEDA
jgi:predicted nucleic acid-binding protein